MTKIFSLALLQGKTPGEASPGMEKLTVSVQIDTGPSTFLAFFDMTIRDQELF